MNFMNILFQVENKNLFSHRCEKKRITNQKTTNIYIHSAMEPFLLCLFGLCVCQFFFKFILSSISSLDITFYWKRHQFHLCVIRDLFGIEMKLIKSKTLLRSLYERSLVLWILVMATSTFRKLLTNKIDTNTHTDTDAILLCACGCQRTKQFPQWTVWA